MSPLDLGPELDIIRSTIGGLAGTLAIERRRPRLCGLSDAAHWRPGRRWHAYQDGQVPDLVLGIMIFTSKCQWRPLARSPAGSFHVQLTVTVDCVPLCHVTSE